MYVLTDCYIPSTGEEVPMSYVTTRRLWAAVAIACLPGLAALALALWARTHSYNQISSYASGQTQVMTVFSESVFWTLATGMFVAVTVITGIAISGWLSQRIWVPLLGVGATTIAAAFVEWGIDLQLSGQPWETQAVTYIGADTTPMGAAVRVFVYGVVGSAIGVFLALKSLRASEREHWADAMAGSNPFGRNASWRDEVAEREARAREAARRAARRETGNEES